MNPNASVPIEEGSPAHAAITLLIDLAQRREIDPWDVDVIKVIDRFFQDLEELSFNQTHLPQSGQAFLWASMLVSFKADTLEALAEDEQEEADVVEDPPTEEAETPHRRLPQKLEHHIRRRGSAPPPQKRRVTLSELITYLQELGEQIQDTSTPSRARSRSSSQREKAQMITHLAHNENLTELATELETFLLQEISLFNSEELWMSLDELAARWKQQQTETTVENCFEPVTEKGNRVGLFWALLLLSAQSKVELSQAAFYQDLHLRFLWEKNTSD
jgi:segregation and condensation protein A